MTLVFADIPSADTGRYGTTKARMLDGIYAEYQGNFTLAEDPDPTITGNVMNFDNAMIRYVYPATNATMGIATRIWLNNIPTLNSYRPAIHQYRDGSNLVKLAIFVSPTGSLQVYRDIDPTSGAGTLIGATSGPVMVAQSWRHVESKVFWSTTVGTVEVRIEGRVVLDLTGVNTGSATYAQVGIGVVYSIVSTPQILSMKDVVFWNGDGSVNNDFIGPCGVYRLTPNADVSSGWSRTSGATDYGLVDEAPPDDADYIYAGESPIPAASIMSLTDLPPDIISIRGVISTARAEKSDGGDGDMQVSMSPNGTDWDAGADNAMSTAFSYYYDVSEISPDTAAAWTPVEVNAMEVKLNRTL